MKKLFMLIFILVSGMLLGQNYSTTSKKAAKLFKQALEVPTQELDPNTGRLNYSAGIQLLEQALKKDPQFWEAEVLTAEYYKNLNNFKAAIKHYKQAVQINPSHSRTGMTYYYLGALNLAEGQYEEALKAIQVFISSPNSNREYMEKAYGIREHAQFASIAIKNPVSFNPTNAGPGINTIYAEYYPTLTVDGSSLLFTRALPFGKDGMQEDFFTSTWNTQIWSKALAMPDNVNTQNNEGAPTISADGRSLIFVACADESGFYGEDRKGRGSCDLFYSKKIGNTWLNPINLPGNVNTFHWESQPSLSADGRTLYFVRGLRGKNQNQNNSDIFVTKLSEDGTWLAAEKLSDVINTPYAEESVHIHPDGKTLYFASKGHVGMGGSDLFVSQMDQNGEWSKPKNLGYPINTSYDENSLIVSADGEMAFLASDRSGGFGDLDIYSFPLPEPLKPTKTLYFDGTVFDGTSKTPLAGHFELRDLNTGKLMIISDADKITGNFTVPLPSNQVYVINVTLEGYIPYSLNFDLSYREGQTNYHIEIPMNPIKSSNENILKNIFFDLNSSNLRPESFIELKNLADFLSKHPNLKIELGGHTDTRGDASINLKLSTDRAKAVYDYLVNTEKIPILQLTFKGYGESQPLVNDQMIQNMTQEDKREAAHQSNRRTVYKIIQ